jgi:hypothetical protein
LPSGIRCTADQVIGQPSANDYGACNGDSSWQTYPDRPRATSRSLCGNSPATLTVVEGRTHANMFVDAQGNLYLPDIENNRILRFPYNIATQKVEVQADLVLGQTDFSGNECNLTGNILTRTFPPPTQTPVTSLCLNQYFWVGGGHGSGGAVTSDMNGNIWVVDQSNHRVLRFPKINNEISKIADLVLGQSDFTSKTSGNTLNKMDLPSALTFNASGNLYIADSNNYRILVFSPPFTTGMNASVTFGNDFAHPNPYETVCNIATHGGCDPNPWDVQLDPQGRGMWTLETLGWGSRVRLWNLSGIVIQEYLGNARGAGSFGIDTLGNVLYGTLGKNDV